MIRLILITLLASAFFSSTYVLNELMSAAGGHWFWSASLRYLFILIILTVLIGAQHGLSRIKELWTIFSEHWRFWMLTGSIGFGVFYAGLCFAADHVSGWVVAATFMFTVVASLVVLMAFGHRFDKKFIFYAAFVLIGVILVNLSEALSPTSGSSLLINTPLSEVLLYGALPCLIAAFSFPIGSQLVWQASYNARQLNFEDIKKVKRAKRSVDQIFWDNEGFDAFEALTTIAPRIVSLDMDDYFKEDDKQQAEVLPKSNLEILVNRIPTIDTHLLSNSFNKVWLMTLGSLPFWFILALFIRPALPANNQIINVALVALLSGVIATSIFLYAREKAQTSSEMAGVDATQASEVIFALVGGIVLLNNPMPSMLGITGIIIIMIGLILFAKDG